MMAQFVYFLLFKRFVSKKSVYKINKNISKVE